MAKDSNVSKDPKVTQLENEAKVIGKVLDVLKYCSFSGHMAQDVAIGQMYLQGLHKHMLLEVTKLEASLDKALTPVASAPLESKVTTSVVDQTPAITVE